VKCQQHSRVGTSCQNAKTLHHEEHEVHEGAPNSLLGAGTRLSFKLFMLFMVRGCAILQLC